jgi:hypothetical protein
LGVFIFAGAPVTGGGLLRGGGGRGAEGAGSVGGAQADACARGQRGTEDTRNGWFTTQDGACGGGRKGEDDGVPTGT